MRKFTFLVLMLIGMITFGQTLSLDKTFTFNKDTSFVVRLAEDATWGLQVNWQGLNALDGVVEVEQANINDTIWNSLGTSFSNTMITTTGSISFEGWYFSHAYMRVKFTKNSVTAGTIRATLMIKRSKQY